MTPRVIVIGGGITGLAAAYRLSRAGATVTLLESQDRLGGKILSEKAGDLTIEGGPDSFITAKPQALELVKELGLSERLLMTDRENTDVYVFVRGKLRRLPEGLMLMAPVRALPFLLSDLMTWRGKLRMALDLALPRGAGDDVSLGTFTRRRFGAEALSTIVQPIMAGIYAGDADALSLKSTFPQFLDCESRHGSVIRGLRAGPRRPAARGGPTMFVTLAGGLCELTEALAERLEPGAIRLNSRVSQIAAREGGGYRVLLNDESLDADAVVVTTASWQAALMVQGMAPDLAAALEEIPFSSTATATLAYETASMPAIPKGFGFVVARQEADAVVAATFTATKFPGRVPAGKTLIRCFLGGAGRESWAEKPDAELLAAVRRDLERLLGLRAEPQLARVYRWLRANPQYNVGHEERLRRIDACLARRPGLALAGASYRGPGLPDCVASGTAAAAAVRAALG